MRPRTPRIRCEQSRLRFAEPLGFERSENTLDQPLNPFLACPKVRRPEIFQFLKSEKHRLEFEQSWKRIEVAAALPADAPLEIVERFAASPKDVATKTIFNADGMDHDLALPRLFPPLGGRPSDEANAIQKRMEVVIGPRGGSFGEHDERSLRRRDDIDSQIQ